MLVQIFLGLGRVMLDKGFAPLGLGDAPEVLVATMDDVGVRAKRDSMSAI
jgi:hypothetical protein